MLCNPTIKTQLVAPAVLALVLLVFAAAYSRASTWEYFGGDPAATRYAPATQITPENVSQLEVVWTARTGEQEEFADKYSLVSFQNTPSLIGDSLIACSPFNRLIAYDPGTGEEKWRFDPWKRLPFVEGLVYRCRGVAYWPGNSTKPTGAICEKRIFMATASNHVFSLDPASGELCDDFGNGGILHVDRSEEMAFPGEILLNNPGTVIGDVVVFGSMVIDSYRANAPSGKIVALDVKTGALRWEYDPIPRGAAAEGHPGWLNDSARDAGGANVWPVMTVDAARDLLFLPTGSPSPDFYGGMRPGDNRDANSLVALRGSTGEKVWSYQIVHHDLWDYDLPAPPVLLNIERGDRTIPAVAQVSKQGLIFVFNRETGVPLFDIEERPVPQTTVPGEWTSPTQPFPVKPAPLLDYRVEEEDAWGFTFWDRGKCEELIRGLGNEGMYTPPSESGTAQKPAWIGGANWGGPAVDPRTGVLVINLSNIVTRVQLEKRTEDMQAMQILTTDDTAVWRRHAGGDMLGAPYRVKLDFLRSPLGAPCTAPPWGILAAVNLASGDLLWTRPLGTIDRLAPLPLPLELGTPNIGGPLITGSGLVFIAATMDDRIRAFALDSGEELWKARLPASGQAGVMSYEWKGRQYVVIAAGGHSWMDTKRGDYYVAFALED